MASTADFKNGLVLNIDGQLWTITEFQHVKPGKGPAFVRTKLKNVLSGKVVDKTYNAGVKVETATVDRRDATYLYRDGADFVFDGHGQQRRTPLDHRRGSTGPGCSSDALCTAIRCQRLTHCQVVNGQHRRCRLQKWRREQGGFYDA